MASGTIMNPDKVKSLGTEVSLSTTNQINYGRSNPFLCPSDGYVTFIHYGNRPAVSSYVIMGNNKIYKLVDVGANTPYYDGIFVKKGMYVYVLEKDISSEYPLVSYIPLES